PPGTHPPSECAIETQRPSLQRLRGFQKRHRPGTRLAFRETRKEIHPMRKDSGFTLIELLIVVAIIGIIAAIAIPNLLNAIDRSKQKRTMADMRSIGTSCEEYSIDNNFYPVQTTQGDVSTITASLTPTYIKA